AGAAFGHAVGGKAGRRRGGARAAAGECRGQQDEDKDGAARRQRGAVHEGVLRTRELPPLSARHAPATKRRSAYSSGGPGRGRGVKRSTTPRLGGCGRCHSTGTSRGATGSSSPASRAARVMASSSSSSQL